jgi:tetratricopeptide (TPR) repeat protein
VNDATDLNGFFKFGAGYDRVELLQNPTGKKDILGAVRSLTAELGPGDFFLFFFAGHGFCVGENHVLVCADDLYEDVKHEYDGLPLGQLKGRLSGSFDSALLLDACQSDILATRGGEGIAERDLSLILEVPSGRLGCGALTVVTSCDAGQTAVELSERRHGLFTTALLDLLKEAQGAHARLDLSDAFRVSLGRRMGEIAARSGFPSEQRPRFSCTGDSCFVLLEGRASSPSEQEPATSPASALVICPVCGKKNDPKDTFKCRVCGRDDLCLEHRDRTTFLCDDCEKSRKAKEGMDWFQKGEDFLNGSNGCRQDHDEAVKCYRKAAELGNRSACHKYGDLLFNGRMGVEKNIQNALEYYLQADANDAWVQYNVGSCYLHFYQETKNGEDGKRAVMWLRKSADAGIPWACVKMGDCYRDGIGVGQDFVQAASWYRRAREQNPENENGAFQWAEWCLGNLYRNGQGVERDLDEALNWFRKAAVRKQEAATCSEAAAAEVEAEQKAKEESSRQAWEESWCNAWEKTKCISQEGVVSNVKEETGRKEKEATSRMVKREVERKSDPKPNGRYQEIANGLTWSFEVNNEKATIGSFSSCTFVIPKDSEGSITIPSALGGCLVTAIGDNAFKGCQGLTSVTIPESVTTIGKEAFGFCKRLTSMTIPRAVTSIGDSAFVYCDALASVTILSRKLMLETNPFKGCRNLTTWILPGGDFPFVSQGVFLLSKDGKTLLAGPAAKGDVTIPYGVTRIGESAFCFCERLTSVTIPRSVTKIDSHAFSFCDGLASVTIPRSVTSIGYASFGHCRSLSLLTKMRLKARDRECL